MTQGLTFQPPVSGLAIVTVISPAKAASATPPNANPPTSELIGGCAGAAAGTSAGAGAAVGEVPGPEAVKGSCEVTAV